MGDKISHQATVMGIALLVVLAVVPITDAQVGQYFVWEAIIQGEVQGQRFQRQAFVYLTTPLSSAGTMNGANPFESPLFQEIPQ